MTVADMNKARAERGITGGRPSIYTPDLVDIARDYVEDCKDTVEHFEGDSGKQWEVWRVKLPTIEGLARRLKINRDTVYAWREKYPEFSDIIDDLLAEQADRLINQGLAGNYNSTISKVLLSGKHGYVEKQEVDTKAEISNPDGSLKPDGGTIAALLEAVKGQTAKPVDNSTE